MKAVKVLGGLMVFLAAIAVGFYAYMGGFKTIKVQSVVFPATEIFYSIHKGPYENLGESWEVFTKKMDEMNVGPCDSLGVYLDPPETAPENLRSIIACKVMSLSPESQVSARAHFKTFTLPEAQSYGASFPYRNMMSFFFAPTRVYPKMTELIESGDIKPSVAIETYGLDEGRSEINIYMPANKQAADYQVLFDAFN